MKTGVTGATGQLGRLVIEKLKERVPSEKYKQPWSVHLRKQLILVLKHANSITINQIIWRMP